MSVKKRLFKAAKGIEDSFDELMLGLRSRLGKTDKLQIVPFRSYGTRNRLYIKGRVLEENPIRKSSAADSFWSNLLSMYQRFESDEIPSAKLKVSFNGKDHYVVTDDEGYFVLDLSTDVAVAWDDMWHEVRVELVEAPVPFAQGLHAIAEVLIPPADAEFGIISDIDDTIVRTGATNLLAMSRNTFLHNAHTRLPFAGVKEFYKALQLGRNGKRNNPFFYVSSSPWNLYDLLTDFMDLNEIPEGPLLLRDFGLNDEKSPSGHMGHKFKEISNILNAYPHLPFVLIGDSGQEDPKIYYEVVKKFPGRVAVIYIRDVQLKDREKIAMDVSQAVFAEKVEMVVVDNTVEAAEHAAKIKLIFSDTVSTIEDDKQKDKGEKGGKEELRIT